MKFYVSIEHRLIGGYQVFDTTATIEADSFLSAIQAIQDHGLRPGHEITRVGVHIIVDDDCAARK
jgi:hypothetical protein